METTTEINKAQVIGWCREALEELRTACMVTVYGQASDGVTIRRAVLRLALRLGNETVAQTVLAYGIERGGIPDEYDFSVAEMAALEIGLSLEAPHPDIQANLDAAEAMIAERSQFA